MPQKPPSPPLASPTRPPAPHVQAALLRAAQAKLPDRPPRAEVPPRQVSKTPPAHPPQAEHVRRALAPAQAKLPDVARPTHLPAPHVRNAAPAARGPAPVQAALGGRVQARSGPRLAAAAARHPGARTGGAIQRMRPQAIDRGASFLIKASHADEDFDQVGIYEGPDLRPEATAGNHTFRLGSGRELYVPESCIFGPRPTVGGLRPRVAAAAAPVAAAAAAPAAAAAARGGERKEIRAAMGGGGGGMGEAEAVSAVSASGRPRRNPGLAGRLDEVRSALAGTWAAEISAGALNKEIDITTVGPHSCGARITVARADGTKERIAGAFDSDRLHAEMDALEKLIESRRSLADIELIEIEKEPCPRCAVVLNRLKLAGKVRYKAAGQRDYPTWRFPDLRENWSTVLGISTLAANAGDQEALKAFFQTHKWW